MEPDFQSKNLGQRTKQSPSMNNKSNELSGEPKF